MNIDTQLNNWFLSASQPWRLYQGKEMNVTCLIWLQLIYFITNEHVHLQFILKVLFKIHKSFTLLLCFS